MRHRIVILVGLAFLASLALVGCGNKITAEEIVAKVQETIETTQDAHAVAAVSVNALGIEIDATAEVWEKSASMYRIRILESSDARFLDAIMVTDGETGWAYEPKSNVATVGPIELVDMPLPQVFLRIGMEFLPALLDATDVALIGQEKLGGYDTYRLAVTAKKDADIQTFPGNGTLHLWIEKEQGFVLKSSYESDTFGSVDMELRSFELNQGWPDSLFQFEVPEGALVVDLAAREPVPLSLEEAIVEAPFPLMVPTYLPEGTTLIEVFRADKSYILRYDHSPRVAFTVVQGPTLADPPLLGEVHATAVRGHDATAIADEAGGNSFLFWSEDGITIVLAGHISLEEALKVAESLEVGEVGVEGIEAMD